MIGGALVDEAGELDDGTDPCAPVTFTAPWGILGIVSWGVNWEADAESKREEEEEDDDETDAVGADGDGEGDDDGDEDEAGETEGGTVDDSPMKGNTSGDRSGASSNWLVGSSESPELERRKVWRRESISLSVMDAADDDASRRIVSMWWTGEDEDDIRKEPNEAGRKVERESVFTKKAIWRQREKSKLVPLGRKVSSEGQEDATWPGIIVHRKRHEITHMRREEK